MLNKNVRTNFCFTRITYLTLGQLLRGSITRMFHEVCNWLLPEPGVFEIQWDFTYDGWTVCVGEIRILLFQVSQGAGRTLGDIWRVVG